MDSHNVPGGESGRLIINCERSSFILPYKLITSNKASELFVAIKDE